MARTRVKNTFASVKIPILNLRKRRKNYEIDG